MTRSDSRLIDISLASTNKVGDSVAGIVEMMDISTFSSRDFILRGGRMPAPITGMKN
jgi:uncharacterized protein (UPF0210 family)